MARSGAEGAASFRRELSAGTIAPVYLIYGEGAFLREEALALLRRAVLKEAGGEPSPWGESVLEGGNAGLAEILDAARTLPMLAPRRLVLVREAEKIREADADSLREYLKDPTPSTCLVFYAGAKPDFRRALFRALQERARSVEFPLPKGPSIPKWIRERAQERGAEIDPEGVALLEAFGGADLFRIDQELTKVLEYLSPSRAITPEALGETLGAAAAGSIFELAERVGSGETAGALLLLRGLLAEGEEPVRLLSLIARQLRILILGKSLVRKGHRGVQLAQALGIPPYPFILEKTQKLIARFPEGAGAPSLRRILEADRALKGGGKGPAVLEKLVLDLTALTLGPGRQREASA